MSIKILPAMGLIVLWAESAQAQSTEPVTQDKAAMERVQREADGPRRRILEAAKLRTAAKGPDTAAPGAPVAAAVPAPAPAPAVALAPAPAPAPVQAPAPVATRALPRATTPESEGGLAVLSAATPPLQAAAPALPSVPKVAAVALTAAAPAMLNVPSAVQLEGLPPPRLVSRVEPDLPLSMFRRGARRTEVVVEMVVNTDGSVRDVSVRESAHPELEPPVLEAVRQWRYERQPVARPHTVRLVVAPS